MRTQALITAARIVAWMLLWLLPSSLMAAQDQLLEEQEVAQEQKVARPAQDPEMQALRQTQLARVQALQSYLSDLSHELGTYDPALIELQGDLGGTYLELEEYELAHGILEQAMQLVRVNDGLYGERQVGLLKSLIQANLGLQEWEQVDIYAHLLLDLQARMFAAGSGEYTDAFISFSDWRLQAARYNLLSRPGSQQGLQALQDLQDQHKSALVSAREREDTGQQWSLLYAIATTEVEMARQINYQHLTGFDSLTPRYVSQTVCRTVPTSSGGAQRVCWQERVTNPDYLTSASNQRRTYVERARLGLQSAVREMEDLLVDNPDFAQAHQQETEQGLENIESALRDLQRQARRSAMQRW